MENKRSKGISIIGWILVLYGLLGFLGNLFENLTYRNKYLWTMLLDYTLGNFPILKNVGLSISDWANFFMSITEKFFSRHPSMLMLQFVFVPFLFSLIFLGGIGILRLKSEWRKATICVFLCLMLTKFIIRIYTASYFIMAILLGKFVNSEEKEIISSLEKIFPVLPRIIIEDLFVKILFTSIIIFCLTHPKIKGQFK